MSYKRVIIKILYFLQGLFFKKYKTCPYCQESCFQIVAKKAWVIDICYCLKCSLYWTNPVFRFWNLYDTLYDGSGLTTRMPKAERLEAELRKDFLILEKDYSAIIAWLKQITQGRKLLEFGSSWGYFLYYAQRQGFEVTGIEISKKRRIFGMDKLKVRILSSLDLAVAEGKRYDTIISFHTLEHMYPISDIFRKLRVLLKDGRILVIAVPFIALNKGKDAFKSIGAVHPIGFCEEFFLKNMPGEGFGVRLVNGLVVLEKFPDQEIF